MTQAGKKKQGPNPYIRFSSVGVQMGLMIGAGAWGGSALDNYLKYQKPVFTIVFSLLAIGISLFLVIREAIRLSKDE
ncbi:MAG: AtpZ/AtpI family protein [Crocinitomicaceae bacterium]|nr:AtpZ/AtpI family protein [Crocinitomicaceae bacterium]MBK8927576.1 AtpZ/AtpI family protein [Crocinitomicaceae bacterium]